MAEKKTTPAHLERGRRSERVLLRIPIEIKGRGTDGQSYKEKTFTLVINRNGARISARREFLPDEQITITNLQSQIACPFRVVRRTPDMLGEGPPEWGVECLEPEVNFWGIGFPTKIATPAEQELIDALLECAKCHARELAKITLDDYRTLSEEASLLRPCAACGTKTGWAFGFADALADEAIPTPGFDREEGPTRGGIDLRRAKRLAVKLPVRIRLKSGKAEMTRTENISKTGVCFSSGLEMKQGEIIQVIVGFVEGADQPDIGARVIWRRHVEGTARSLYGVHLEAQK